MPDPKPALESLPLKDQVSALEKVHGTATAMLPEPERSQRLAHAKERLRIEEDRIARERMMDQRIAQAEAREALRDSEADAFAARAVGMTDAALPSRSLYVAAYGDKGADRDRLIDEACYAVQDLRLWAVDNAPRPETRRVDKAPGRNDPCPCGSGKKYKKCHGAA